MAKELPQVPLSLEELIGVVESLAPSEDEVHRLRDAVLIAEQLSELGDHLVDHFVELARRSGATWATIGAALGVSKQAAQKRFVPPAGPPPNRRLFSRFTPRARKAVELGRDYAGHASEVEPRHLLAGLMTDPEAISYRAVEALGASPADVIARAVGQDPPGKSGSAPFSVEAKLALRAALKAALLRGHNYIGTEHLMIGLLEADAASTAILAELGLEAAAVESRLDEVVGEVAARRSAG